MKHLKLISKIVVATAVVLLVPTVAYGTNLFGLQESSLGEEDVSLPTEEERIVDMISLQGTLESPEYKACKEWREFEQQYDADGSILAQVGNSIVGLGEYEEIYGCYTQEMVDKADEICEKYQLEKLTGFEIIEDYNDFLSKVGVGDFMKGPSEEGTNTMLASYFYQNGAFHVEGTATLTKPSPVTVGYQFKRSMKGVFDVVMLNVGDLDNYKQWEYTTSNGETVLLASSSNKSLIMADKEKSFVVINVLSDMEPNGSGVSVEALEELAEIFDFSVIP